VRLAARWKPQLGGIPARYAQQVDAAHHTARRRQKIGVSLPQDAVQQGAKLDADARAQPQLLGAGPYQRSRLRHVRRQLLLVTERLQLQPLEEVTRCLLRRAVLAARGEDGLAQKAQQLIAELGGLGGVVRAHKRFELSSAAHATEAATEVTGGVGWRGGTEEAAMGREDDEEAAGAAAATVGGCGAEDSLAST
jgi:hypothetical protein